MLLTPVRMYARVCRSMPNIAEHVHTHLKHEVIRDNMIIHEIDRVPLSKANPATESGHTHTKLKSTQTTDELGNR